MLHNLFKECWKPINADMIFYKLTSSVGFDTRKYKKSKKLMKIDKITNSDRKIFIFFEKFWKLQRKFQKDVTCDNIKSKKSQGWTLSLKETFFEKSHEESGNWQPCSRFMVKLQYKFPFWSLISQHIKEILYFRIYV